MKIKLLFVAIVIFCLCGIVSAQKDVEFRQEFDAWKTSVSKNAVDSPDQLFLMAKARRIDSESARVKVGLFGVFRSYEITVTPLKYEKGADGKLVQTEVFEKVKISMKSPAGKISGKPEFSDPTITFFADAEANAVEIQLKTNDGKNPKITLSLSQDQDTIGTLTNAK